MQYTSPAFPLSRMRRLRSGSELRALVRETHLSPYDFVYPLFVVDGEGRQEPIGALPGQSRWSVDLLLAEVEAAWSEGIRAVILFGLPTHKDATGSQAYSPDAPVQKAAAALKARWPELVIMTDVCLCQYTDHGHCGPLRGESVDNDAAVELLARTAVSHAEAGANIVAPSDMMDGRVGAIRRALDAAGHQNVGILSYAVKFSSGFYGPFREAADSKPSFGDRRSYQMDPANRREALREAALDVAEGADMLMVKPALAYLDILRDLRESFPLPLACYNVSGEYSMIKAAAQNGWLDERAVALETLLAMKRAGADLILTYFARDAAKWLA
jgi:porphobilinogen synthase